MCGRYDLTELPLELFELMVGDPIRNRRGEALARYNIAPSQKVPIIRRGSDGQLELVETRWGLLPYWSKQSKVPSNTLPISRTWSSSASKREILRSPEAKLCCTPDLGSDRPFEWK